MTGELRETAYNQVSSESHATLYVGEQRWINKVHKLKNLYPDLVDIRYTNPDGSMVVHIPKTWFSIRPPRKMNLTDEQKEQRQLLLADARKRKAESKNI